MEVQGWGVVPRPKPAGVILIILGIDVETTGLDCNTHRITELGMVLYDTDRKQPLRMYCEYVKIDSNVPPMITQLTGITDGDLSSYGIPIEEAMAAYFEFCELAEYQVAHNAPFDRGFINAEITRIEAPGVPKDIPWIDTSVDVRYPEGIQTRKLEFLGPAHGFLNPWSHRALFDVLSMLKVLDNYDINEVTRLAGEPDVTMIAICQKPWDDKAADGKKDTDKAKGMGYRWNGTAKQWQKKVKQSQISAEQNNGELKVQVLEAPR